MQQSHLGLGAASGNQLGKVLHVAALRWLLDTAINVRALLGEPVQGVGARVELAIVDEVGGNDGAGAAATGLSGEGE